MGDLNVGDRAEVFYSGRWYPKGEVAEILPLVTKHGSGVVRIGEKWYPRVCVRRAVPPDERIDRPPGYVKEVKAER